MTTYETQFIQQLGATNEKINIKFEYGKDFTGDGKDDMADEPPPPGEDGIVNTPGFWKQSQHFQFWEQPYDPTDSFRSRFGLGVNVSLPFTDSLLGALSAGGSGIFNDSVKTDTLQLPCPYTP